MAVEGLQKHPTVPSAGTELGMESSYKHLVGLSLALQLRDFTPGSGKHFKDIKHFVASEL